MKSNPIYEVRVLVFVLPEYMDAAIEELLHANSVEVLDERGVLEVVEQVVAPNEFVAFGLAHNLTNAQLEAGGIEYYNVDRDAVSVELVSC